MALAATVDKVTVPNPGGCWGAGFAVEGSSQRLVPLSQAIGCMKSMTVSKKIALQTVKAYDDMFRLSYAFYDVARDPSATFPDTIPTTWSVYSSPDQGKVDLSKKSAELMADIDANGRADGMLALKLNSIYALPRDGHTAIGALPPYSIALVLLDTSMNEDGAMIPEETYYLSLSRGEDGVIRPVYRYEDAEGNVVRERQIESINGENALDVLIKYTSNIGLGGAGAQMHSPGSRMNGFLRAAVVQDGSVIPGLLWSFELTHDVSSLPDECLNITFKASGAGEAVNADGATDTQWCFVAMINGDSDGDYTRPVEFYDDQLATPGKPFKQFDQFFNIIEDAYPSVGMFGPQVSSLDGQPAARRALKQATNDPTTACGSDYLNMFELSIEDNWKATYFGCREDPNSQKLVAAYKMLDDGVMVFRYPEFVSLAETQFAWRSAVRFARENNATKLLIDMIENGGGDVDTQYFLRYAMYPEMTYDDWKDEYTQRVSPKMLQIINYIAQGSEVVSLLNEYRDEFVAAVQDSDEESLEEVFGSTSQLLKFVTEAVSVAGNLNLGAGGGESVGSLLSQTADRFDRIANGTEPFSVDAFVEFLNTADGIITSQIGTYGRQTLFQGGSNVTTTGFYNLFTTPADYLTQWQASRVRFAVRVVRPSRQRCFRKLCFHIRAGGPSVRQKVCGRGDASHGRVFRLSGGGSDVSTHAIFGRPAWWRKWSAQRRVRFRSRGVRHQQGRKHHERDGRGADGVLDGLCWRGTSWTSARSSSSRPRMCHSSRPRMQATRITPYIRMLCLRRRTPFRWSS